MAKQITIIVGIDFSDSSPIVLRHGMESAKAQNGALIAVHVLDQGLLESRKASGQGNPAIEILERQAEEKFKTLLAGKVNECELKFLVRFGKPAVELCKVAKDMEAVIMVICANDMTKRRMGTIASRCVRMSPCDVLILRDWQGGSFKKIVVCTDFSATADRAIQRAAMMAMRDGSFLEIVNVIYPPGRDAWGAVLDHAAAAITTYEEECRAKVRSSIEKCVERNQIYLRGLKYETLILESVMASAAITAHVQSIGADLVVLGTQGHSALASYFLGTNAERLVQDAPVSVLAVR